MQLADTLLALFVLCAAFAGAATLQGAERCRDDAGAAAWQADTLRIAARQLPPSSTPETVRLSVPDDLTSLPPGFSAEGAGGRPFREPLRSASKAASTARQTGAPGLSVSPRHPYGCPVRAEPLTSPHSA